MATRTLKLRPGAPARTDRAPVRGRAPRKRPTLAEAQAQRQQAPARKTEPMPPRTRPAPRQADPSTPRALPELRRPAPAAPRMRPAPHPAEPAPPRAAQPPRRPVAGNAAATTGIRLSKRMTELGLASRREADEWIEAGRVRVNGRRAVLGQRIGPDDRIEIDPQAQRQQAQRLTVLLHKPVGYVSGQAEDGHRPAAMLVTPSNRWREDRMPLPAGALRGLAPAGRLDIDSTGLLVLTQDGRVAKHLIGHESDVEKEYLVRVKPRGVLASDALQRLHHGLELDGVKLRPAKVSWANEDQLRFVLREGRKRQIRRMCDLVGLEVLALKRVRIGSVVLGKLPAGQWRLLRWDERF
jgi:23S rRNA pseudouridine2604 synthase